VFYSNAAFTRENEGLLNLNGGVDWFVDVKNQALLNGTTAIVSRYIGVV